MTGPLRLELVDGVATVTIDQPPINLFDLALYGATVAMADQLRDDPEVRVVVLRSANPEFFIAHFDVTLIQHLPADQPRHDELNAFHAMCEAFRTMPKATIAVVEGRVGGGGSELALSCDMRSRRWGVRCSASRRWRWASCPAAAARLACRASSVGRVRSR